MLSMLLKVNGSISERAMESYDGAILLHGYGNGVTSR